MRVSAVVCSRNRAASLARTVRSLLIGQAELLELIVIDQSDCSDSEAALAPFLPDRRLRYVRSKTHGKGAGLNEALSLAATDIVVLTDDDCEAPANWAGAMARTLESRPSVAIVFCNVSAGPCDWSSGYIPTYERRESRIVRSLLGTCGGHGMGAGMALRRDAILAMGGFDETIGPGSRIPAGDDWDIEHRALLKGWHVYESADLSIVHHGFRTFLEGSAHARRDWFGIGAVCAKSVRIGHLTAAVVASWYALVYVLLPIARELLQLKRPRGRSRIAGFVQGFSQGLRTPVDRATHHFLPRER